MKNLLKYFGLFLLALSMISLTSCRSDDDPADNNFFAGTYNGTVTYSGESSVITNENGKVFVTKIGSGTTYNFAFSDSIPDLNGIEFKREGDNSLVMVGSTETYYIRIDSNVLKILYTKDGKIWTANATR